MISYHGISLTLYCSNRHKMESVVPESSVKPSQGCQIGSLGLVWDRLTEHWRITDFWLGFLLVLIFIRMIPWIQTIQLWTDLTYWLNLTLIWYIKQERARHRLFWNHLIQTSNPTYIYNRKYFRYFYIY